MDDVRNARLSLTDRIDIAPGGTFNEIADFEGVSMCCIQQLIELAFQAPDFTRCVREGRQSIGLTSDWLIRHAFSPIWQD